MGRGRGRYREPMPANPGDLSRKVGILLRDRMEARGVTQTAMARQMSLSQGQLSRLLSGERRWDLDQLADFCLALGTRASDLIAVAEDTLED